LHMAQLMPLPLTVSCFSKIQIGFTFLVPAHPGSPRKRAVKLVWCVCVCLQFTWKEFIVLAIKLFWFTVLNSLSLLKLVCILLFELVLVG